MIPTTRHARRVTHLVQLRAGRRYQSSQAISREQRRIEKAVPEDIMDRPDIIERQVQVMNLQERGADGNNKVDPYMQISPMTGESFFDTRTVE